MYTFHYCVVKKAFEFQPGFDTECHGEWLEVRGFKGTTIIGLDKYIYSICVGGSKTPPVLYGFSYSTAEASTVLYEKPYSTLSQKTRYLKAGINCGYLI